MNRPEQSNFDKSSLEKLAQHSSTKTPIFSDGLDENGLMIEANGTVKHKQPKRRSTDTAKSFRNNPFNESEMLSHNQKKQQTPTRKASGEVITDDEEEEGHHRQMMTIISTSAKKNPLLAKGSIAQLSSSPSKMDASPKFFGNRTGFGEQEPYSPQLSIKLRDAGQKPKVAKESITFGDLNERPKVSKPEDFVRNRQLYSLPDDCSEGSIHPPTDRLRNPFSNIVSQNLKEQTSAKSPYSDQTGEGNLKFGDDSDKCIIDHFRLNEEPRNRKSINQLQGAKDLRNESDSLKSGALPDLKALPTKVNYIHFSGDQTLLARVDSENGELLAIYQGGLQGGLPNGVGTLKYSQEEYYQGNWKDGLAEKEGILCTKHFKYQGTFSEGLFEGDGLLTIYGKGVYEGKFAKGQLSGRGRYTWSDGSKVYVGTWKENQFNGKGIMMWADGKKFYGEYFKGKKHGKGVCVYSSGKYIKGVWCHGQLIRDEV